MILWPITLGHSTPWFYNDTKTHIMTSFGQPAHRTTLPLPRFAFSSAHIQNTQVRVRAEIMWHANSPWQIFSKCSYKRKLVCLSISYNTNQVLYSLAAKSLEILFRDWRRYNTVPIKLYPAYYNKMKHFFWEISLASKCYTELKY